jgi:hypothetical protein
VVKGLKTGDMALLRVRRGPGAVFVAVKVGGPNEQKPAEQKPKN